MWMPKAKILIAMCIGINGIIVANANEYRVTNTFMEVRMAPGRMQPVHVVVEKGETFSVLKKKTDWLKVKASSGENGWVNIENFYLATGRTDFDRAFQSVTWEIASSVGSFGGDEVYGISGGYYINRYVRTELDYSKTAGTYSSSTLGTANISLKFFHRFVVSPYIMLGGGVMNNLPRNTLVNGKETRQLIYLYGGGISTNPYKNFGIRFSVRNYYLTEINNNYFDWRIGIYGVFI